MEKIHNRPVSQIINQHTPAIPQENLAESTGSIRALGFTINTWGAGSRLSKDHQTTKATNDANEILLISGLMLVYPHALIVPLDVAKEVNIVLYQLPNARSLCLPIAFSHIVNRLSRTFLQGISQETGIEQLTTLRKKDLLHPRIMEVYPTPDSRDGLRSLARLDYQDHVGRRLQVPGTIVPIATVGSRFNKKGFAFISRGTLEISGQYRPPILLVNSIPRIPEWLRARGFDAFFLPRIVGARLILPEELESTSEKLQAQLLEAASEIKQSMQ